MISVQRANGEASERRMKGFCIGMCAGEGSFSQSVFVMMVILKLRLAVVAGNCGLII